MDSRHVIEKWVYNTSIDPLTHAATDTVNNTGGHTHKGVKLQIVQSQVGIQLLSLVRTRAIQNLKIFPILASQQESILMWPCMNPLGVEVGEDLCFLLTEQKVKLKMPFSLTTVCMLPPVLKTVQWLHPQGR